MIEGSEQKPPDTVNTGSAVGAGMSEQELGKEITIQRGDRGETTIAYLPSVYESSSDIAQEIRERREHMGSVALRSRNGALRRLYPGFILG